jgi:hypothetical protein
MARKVRIWKWRKRSGLTVSAVKAAIYRLRVRYRELLQAEVARTVASEADFEAEIRALQASFLNRLQALKQKPGI